MINKQKEHEKEVLEIVDDIRDMKGVLYNRNKALIDRVNKLLELQDEVNRVSKKYNINLSNIEEMSLDEHMEHLANGDIYKIEKYNNDNYVVLDSGVGDRKTIQKIGDDYYTLYHGTSIANAKRIIKRNRFMANKRDIDELEYNKIYFAPKRDGSILYGLVGGISEYKPSNNNEYIIFECNLNNFYTYITMEEYFVWGNMDADCIEKIYLYKNFDFVKEISKDELLKLGVQHE